MKKMKDANELLKNDMNKLKELATDAEAAVGMKAVGEPKEMDEEKASLLKEYKKNSAGLKLQSFMEKAKKLKNTYSTGFKRLDKELDGGFHGGEFILVGAIPSLGKTTFCLSIADSLCMAGHDVLFFTIEQSEFELMAKSMSRISYELYVKKTAREIIDICQDELDELPQPIDAIFEEYKEFTEEKLYFIEGLGEIGVEKGAYNIRKIVENHIELTGNKPVVIIDYIQILAPHNERATDKQNIDKSVNALKRLSRDFNIPVVGIAAFNRESYSSGVNMSSFRESSSLEYGSDVLIGLQYNAMNNTKFDINAERAKEAKDIELVVLKNRSGRAGGKLYFSFNSKYNHFEEIDKPKPELKSEKGDKSAR